MHSIHIVRRYGFVGGMENYVCHLTNSLVNQGELVTVLCEKASIDQRINAKHIHVIELGNIFSKPRWLAQWGFSRRVSQFFKDNPVGDAIIHSHERTGVHHVTTFHGPPFLQRKKRFLDFLSPRIYMWSFLERRELLGAQVRAILPNSPLIAEQLKAFYPSIVSKVLPPAYPGVTAEFARIERQKDTRLVVGFLGKEWKRKGLDIACDIMLKLREELPDVHFLVAGCDPLAIKPLFADWPKDSYTLAGWMSDPAAFLGRIDLLLHPARAEPFGMVVAEANAAHVPVVVSEHCGVAALIGASQGAVCDLAFDCPDIDHWVEVCRELLAQKLTVKSLALSWEDLAAQHIDLYRRLSLEMTE
jgi:UDP-glucose:(heptosyl)LPS alpha-1,3-glucosyltransferase